MNYNTFHKKNKKVQKKIITKRNYTYQTLIGLVDGYFKKKEIVFDLGCGVGSIDFYLARRMRHIFGFDISSDAVKTAKLSAAELNINNVNFEKINLNKLKNNKKIDYIICSEVLEHVEHDIDLVRVMFQLLKKDGIAIVSSPLQSAPLFKLGLLTDFDNQVGHLRRYTPESFAKMFTDTGFMIVEEIHVEGLLRNLLYTNKLLGKLVRFIRFPVTVIVNVVDNFVGNIFGYSNIYLVVRKP
jgi:SAM-dependent methyltransferase